MRNSTKKYEKEYIGNIYKQLINFYKEEQYLLMT